MTGTMDITILGCGSSGGVPRVGGDWGVCDPAEPKNRRSRCSVLVEYWESDEKPAEDKRTVILIDTSPDLREQLLKTRTQHIDAILYTHEHADQTHGIDDVRAIAYLMRSQIPVYMDEHTKTQLFHRFGYCFETPDGRVHPPILDLKPLIKAGDAFSVSGPGGSVNVDVLSMSHGPTPCLGFILNGKAAYSPDVWEIDDTAIDKLQGMELWIVDALRYSKHPTHSHSDKSLSWIARTQTKQAVLTNLHIDMDYNILSAELPGRHCAGYDGKVLRLK